MNFLNSETGAVTVDWVILTAGLVGLGLAAISVVSIGVQDVSDDIAEVGSNPIVASSFGGMAARAANTALQNAEFTVDGEIARNTETPMTLPKAFAAEATVRFDDLLSGNQQTIFFLGDDLSSQGVKFTTRKSDNGIRVRTYYDDGSSEFFDVSNIITDGEETRFGLSMDESGAVNVLKNGEVVGSGNVTPWENDTTLTNARLNGSWQTGTEQGVVGEVSDFRLAPL